MDDAERPHSSNEGSPDRAPTVGPSREAPGYDPSQEGYTGISAGTLGSLGDAVAARDLAEMVVDTVREGLLVLDTDLRVRVANESFYDAFRVKPEDTVGRLVYDLGDGQWDLPELRELLENILPHERAFDGYEVDHDFEGIGHRCVLLNARRLDDHAMILLAIEDVTERRKGERELQERERELRDAHVALRDAHAALKGQAEEVRRLALALTLAEQEERQRIAYVLHEDLQQVLAAASMAANPDGLQALLQDAIELTRTLAHELSPPLLQGEDVGDLLRWAAQQARERHGLDVGVEVRDGASVPEPALRVLLYQFLSELLFNVAKHAGTGRVRLVAERGPPGSDGGVRVVVEDEGAGFDPAALSRSDGLGLPGVRERLELVGGRLEVESEPGQGTRITITVPVGGASAEGVS